MVNPFKRKNLLPLLGFLPSEIRFQNGNGNGNGDADGGISLDLGGGFSLDLSTGGLSLGAEPGQCEVSTGITGAGEASPELSLDQALDILGGAYPASQPSAPSAPSEPSTLDDLSKTFSPPEPAWPSETRFVEAWEHPVALYSEATAKAIGMLINQMVTTVLGFVPLGSLIKSWVDTLFGQPLSSTVSKGLAGARMTRGELAMSEFTSPESQIPAEGNLEPILSLSVPQKEPSSYPSIYYAKTPSQSLSTSLFGVTEKVTAKEGEGLMIFPSSASGIEKEGSSLLKKQEPVIDSTSMLFLLGMGVVGMVLRKGARA